jgi:diguanylate cyclase (GGDEF)-like protein
MGKNRAKGLRKAFMEAKNKSQFKILIVDDVPKNIQVAASILRESGYKMAFAQDGRTALSMSKSKRFDLILLDIMMPEMDGFEVCRKIRSIAVDREVPIIFLTAKEDADSIVKGFELGAVDYLTKPFNGAELIARVKTHLELYRSKKELLAANARLNKEIKERIKVEKELQRSKEEYRNLSNHDSLTGFYNTRYLYSAVDALIAECRRNGKPFSLIFLDIDNFKNVVDTHGHLNGSRALAEIAGTINGCLSEPAYGVAYGGDEFVVVLPGHDHPHALEKAEHIRSKMLATIYLPTVNDGVHLQASFGVSTYPDDATDIKNLLAKADQAMFQVKSEGKNAVAGASRRHPKTQAQ